MSEPAANPSSSRFELEPELRRDLGLFSATAIIVGGIIGSGIFGAPAAVAQQLQSPGLFMLVWIVGGILAFCGAVCFAELGGMIPRTGGQLIYLREVYPPVVAFLYGWIEVFLMQAGAIAAIAVICITYLGFFIPAISSTTPLFMVGDYIFSTRHAVMMLAIVLLGVVNYIGVRFGAFVMNLLTVSKLTALVGLAILVAAIGEGDWGHFTPLFPENMDMTTVSVFGASMIGVLFAYQSWHNANMVAGEIRDPQRMLPLAIIFGLLTCIIVYMAVNWSYLYIMSIGEVASSERIATDVAVRVIGPIGGGFIALAVMLSTLGTMNGTMLVVPRVTYAMAKEGLFFDWLTYVHPTYGTPSRSIVALTVAALFWTFLGDFQTIINSFAYAMYTFFTLTVIALFILRRKYPDAHRSVKAWGYPVTPILFIAISVWYIGTVLVFKTMDSLPGLVFLAIGLPIYFFWFRKVK